jgi:GNAT superfamily N-acetyltransferase
MLNIRVMCATDIPVGMRLKAQAGWNQLEADWRRFLEMQPDGCFIAELDGAPVGTTMACIFGPVAWIAMVLVDAQVRGRGIGKSLMQHALAFLDNQGVRTVRLDATPLGQPLYEKLGFKVEYTLARHEGILRAAVSFPFADGPHAVTSAQATDFEDICQLDEAVSRTDRRTFLTRLFHERPEEVRITRQDGKIVGYRTVRSGANALQIGPCMAAESAGPLLLADAWLRHAGERVFIDTPVQNQTATHLAQKMGLTVQRQLVRMTRGPSVDEDTARLWASSGPELG